MDIHADLRDLNEAMRGAVRVLNEMVSLWTIELAEQGIEIDD